MFQSNIKKWWYNNNIFGFIYRFGGNFLFYFWAKFVHIKKSWNANETNILIKQMQIIDIHNE